LWSVTTCRPWNSGSGGNRVWNIRPTACPRVVEKLLSTSSGLCGVALACPWCKSVIYAFVIRWRIVSHISALW
jgi:hypothetical protein